MFSLIQYEKEIFYANILFKSSSHHVPSMHARQPCSLSHKEAQLTLLLSLIEKSDGLVSSPNSQIERLLRSMASLCHPLALSQWDAIFSRS
jgi:hypothetical protein